VVEPAEPLASPAAEPAESPIASTSTPAPAIETPAPPPTISIGRPAPPTQSSPAPAAGGRRYVVAKGDTLFAIAKRHYGTASNARVQSILNANRAVLPNAGALQPGMTLVLP
jgi:nucleoid-associated protein YgaU